MFYIKIDLIKNKIMICYIIMYFIWRLFSNNITDSMNNIINSGYIKPSFKSKNVGLYGIPKGSKYIFLSYYSKKNKKYFTKLGGPIRFIINPFYFKKIYYNIGWHGKLNNKKPIDTTAEHLYEIESEIISSLTKKKDIEETDKLMSHELLTNKSINLEKAVIKIEIQKNLENIDEIIKKINSKYPNIKVKKVEK